MDLSLNETQKLVQDTAREFATRVIEPVAREIDEKERFPREILKGLAELGLMAVNVPEDVGGSGAGVVSYALAMQEVARACASTAVTMAVTNMVGEVIATFAERRQVDQVSIDPKVEVTAKAAGHHQSIQVGIGGGNEAHVGSDGFFAADPLELLVL